MSRDQGMGQAVSCLHLDGACTSWEACANRVSKHSAERVEFAMELQEQVERLGSENARLRAALAAAHDNAVKLTTALVESARGPR